LDAATCSLCSQDPTLCAGDRFRDVFAMLKCSPSVSSPAASSCWIAGTCSDSEHTNALTGATAVCVLPASVSSCGTATCPTGLRRVATGCADDTIPSAAVCTRIGGVWKHRAFDKASCEAAMTCKTPSAMYPGRTATCSECGGVLSSVYRWSPGTSATPQHFATQWLTGSGLKLNSLQPDFNVLRFRQFAADVAKSITVQKQRNMLMCKTSQDANLLAFACLCGQSEASCASALNLGVRPDPVPLGSASCPPGVFCGLASGQTTVGVLAPTGDVSIEVSSLSETAGISANYTPSRRLGSSLQTITSTVLVQTGDAVTVTLSSPLSVFTNASSLCLALPVGTTAFESLLICAGFPDDTDALLCQPTLSLSVVSRASNQICVSAVLATVHSQLSPLSPGHTTASSVLFVAMAATNVSNTVVVQTPVDCVMSNWSVATCDAQCGGGVLSSFRTIVTLPQFGGVECGTLKNESTCNLQECAAIPPTSAHVVWFKIILTNAPATLTPAYRSSVRYAIAHAASNDVGTNDVFLVSVGVDASSGRRLSAANLSAEIVGYVQVSSNALISTVVTRLQTPAVFSASLALAGLSSATATVTASDTTLLTAPKTSSNKDSGFNIGLIAGIASGGVVVVAGIALVAFVLRRNAKRKHAIAAFGSKGHMKSSKVPSDAFTVQNPVSPQSRRLMRPHSVKGGLPGVVPADPSDDHSKAKFKPTSSRQ
jgi:hypothetical protein